MALHVVVGAGQVGSALSLLLADRGHQVRVVTRSGRGPEHLRIERVRADAANRGQLTLHARGAAVLYNCANPPSYEMWAAQWPPLSAALLASAEETGAVLVTTSNLYGYGPVDGPISRDHPLKSSGAKGQLRARMWVEALAAHKKGRVRVTEARASDYIGWGVGAANGLIARYATAMLAGKRVWTFGDPDVVHSFTDVADVARTLATLATDERAWGQAWHVPTNPPLSVRTVLNQVATRAGVESPKISRVPHWALRSMYSFVPVLRELDEVLYQFERPFVIDAEATTQVFGIEPTLWSDVLEGAVAYWRSESRASLR